jgi:hypothetical protein
MIFAYRCFQIWPALPLLIGFVPSVLHGGFIHNSTNGHDYLVVPSGSPGTSTWLEADAAAQTYSYGGVSGHLVTITDAAELSFLIDLVEPYRRGGTEVTTDSFWIGGRRNATDPSLFEWVTGETWSFVNWGIGEPNGNPSEPYLEMYNVGPADYPTAAYGVWNDITNAGQGFPNRNGFIVEVDSVSAVPEPASLTLFGLGALGLAVAHRRRTRGKPQVALRA